MNKSYKIFYKLFILPSETHFGIPVSECNCGVCPNFVEKKNFFVIEKGEKYFCRIMQEETNKKLKDLHTDIHRIEKILMSTMAFLITSMVGIIVALVMNL